MMPLSSELRSVLENSVLAARSASEEAARAALDRLAVNQGAPHTSMDETQRKLRNELRAKARYLGSGNQIEGFEPLVEDIAYQQWHRMLFARFLAANELLMHPSGVAVTLAECADLAAEEGEPDAWSVASRYASRMLPGIFLQGDPAVIVRYAPEGRQKLEQILDGLADEIFTADDSLGWVYQFWQSEKKKEINASERKIGGADLAPVTQLFTEDYMVRFLLENSLGAWWEARHPESPLIKDYEYLRFKDDGESAAGMFPGWPDRAAEVTVMDPCCGSGHFLVRAFEMLRKMRIEEEGISEADAADAVLRDNIFGLEIDPRCTQIAAFALVMAAWKLGGFRPIPTPNVACSGLVTTSELQELYEISADDVDLQALLTNLSDAVSRAGDLGSLIDPVFRTDGEQVYLSLFDRLDETLQRGDTKHQPEGGPFLGAAARHISSLKSLSRDYCLVCTNVPFLARGKQNEALRDFASENYPDSKANLATVFLERCLEFLEQGATLGIVSPQNWHYQKRYLNLRTRLLEAFRWLAVAKLGHGAFETITGEVVNVSLSIISNQSPDPEHHIAGIDIMETIGIGNKSHGLKTKELIIVSQSSQLRNPNAVLTLTDLGSKSLLAEYASGLGGITTSDSPRFRRYFWEIDDMGSAWKYDQLPVNETTEYGGRQSVLFWEDGNGELARLAKEGGATIAGREAWGKRGVALQKMGNLPATIYAGDLFENVGIVILPKMEEHLSAIWEFCRSGELGRQVRLIDQSIGVTCNTVVEIPFDLERWKKEGQQSGPLAPPSSNDPTQWLFSGNIRGSSHPLQVGVAHLLGFRWPEQKHHIDANLVDLDGIVCIPPVAGEVPAAQRLRDLYSSVYGSEWSEVAQNELLNQMADGGKNLTEWLRDDFFELHCSVFLNRPFIWHLWDGLKDGFSALVDCHSLDAARLDRLIFTYLGDWIQQQRARANGGEDRAEARLVAAIKLQERLKLIRGGEPPYDIYIRWKPLHEQPIGWDPDLNDGVRLNIRPFVKAGVLREKVSVHWKKDRGKNPDGSERINDLHFTVAEKLKAREQLRMV